MNMKEEAIAQVRERLKKRMADDLMYDINGARGRSIKIYPYKCIINTSVTVGSVLTHNATDGEKTIYFKDVVGVQFKKPGATLGYLQFETASGAMNNEKSNFFNENTFTFVENGEQMQEVYEYVLGIIEEMKLGNDLWNDELPDI